MNPTTLTTDYAGEKGAMFRLALKTGLLTVLTLGFYRFWMKTRLRRYYWSAIRPGGAPMEYVGEPLEKLLGFLVAVVFMAFYIGIVNLVLMFLSFSLFQTNATAYAISFVGVLPIVFFAQYRARRYILARTRWRGIRFGLEPGAWGYAWRAAVFWIIAIVSAGILYPLKAFALEKYRTDRTFFGSERLYQGGRWTMLFAPMKHFYIAGAITAVCLFLGVYLEKYGWLVGLFVSVPWFYFGFAYWKAGSFRRLTSAKTLGGTAFTAQPRTGRVLGIYLGGYFLTYICVSGAVVALTMVAAILAGMGLAIDPEILLQEELRNVPTWLSAGFFIAAYFTVFILWGVLTHVFVTLPLAQHYAETVTLTDAHHLAEIHQRDRDEFAEAEGFADALDVGAAL